MIRGRYAADRISSDDGREQSLSYEEMIRIGVKSIREGRLLNLFTGDLVEDWGSVACSPGQHTQRDEL